MTHCSAMLLGIMPESLDIFATVLLGVEKKSGEEGSQEPRCQALKL
jgi:hypothetical protein